MKVKKVIKPIQKPMRRVGNWCLQLWDGISGKDYRRLKQLRHELAAAQDRAAHLTQQLDAAQTEHNKLTQQLDAAQTERNKLVNELRDRNHELATSHQAINEQQATLEKSQTECNNLAKELRDRNHELANSHQALNERQAALEKSQQELAETQHLCDELSQDIDQWIIDSENQIQTLQKELTNQTTALTNCESNLAAIHRTYAQAPDSNLSDEGTPINLANWKIAFVGGHEATRRAVIQTLRTEYGLGNTPVEIPSHKEVSTSQKQLQQKLAECDLIISIVRYSNHSLTKSLKHLQERGALKGTILATNSRGATGVVREILAFVDQHPDWLNNAAG